MKYKRKFAVPGDTIKSCWDFRNKCRKEHEDRPCEVVHNSYTKDESKCPYPINKPTTYVVSETEDGQIQCSCPHWKFRRETCNHIRKVMDDPEKYEVDPEWTGRSLDAMRKVTQ